MPSTSSTSAAGARSKTNPSYCPVCNVVGPREALVRGFEFAKDEYVRITAEELKAFESQDGRATPPPTVDLVATLKKSLEARRPLAKAGREGAGEKKPAVKRKPRRRAS